MAKIYIVLAVFFLARLASGQCEKGCLRCDPVTSTCLFCDLPLGYVSDSGRCKQVNPQSCLIIDSLGNCLLCDNSTYLDESTGKCIMLLTTQIVANCKIYDKNTVCTTCETEYYIRDGLCVPVAVQIRGCLSYQTNGQFCDVCQENFIRSPTGDRCDIVSSSDSCLQKTYLSCRSCRPGFLYNQNLYRSSFFTYNSNDMNSTGSIHLYKDLISFWSDYRFGVKDSGLVIPCEPTSLLNCAEYFNSSACNVCQHGYYRNASLYCNPIPEKQIPHCINYTSGSVCRECENGFFLTNDFLCIDVNLIDNCDIYAGDQLQTTCKRCLNGYYVFQNFCVKRTILDINNCQTLRASSEGCELCKPGFQLTSDFGKCLSLIPNCVSYDSSSSNSDTLTCLACDAGYALESNACNKGLIPNCLYFNKASDCAQCNYTYYLSSNNCTAHQQIDLCQIYDPVVPNTCNVCVSSAFLFLYDTSCAPLNITAYCETWSNYNTCTSCKLGYVLSNNVCVQIPLSENCGRKDANNQFCTLCNPEYYLVNGACVRHFQFQLQNCMNITNSGSSPNFQCSACKNYNMIFDYTGLPVCLSSSEINSSFIPFCAIHSYSPLTTPATLNCLKCIDGKILSNNRTACVDSCPTDVPIILDFQSTLDPTRGPICDASVNTTVSEYYSIQGNNYINLCHPSAITYHSQDVQLLSFTKTNNIVSRAFNLGVYRNQIFCDPTPISTLMLFFPGNSTRDANCAMYTKLNGKYYCRRCAMGRTGPLLYDTSVTPNEPYVTCSQIIDGCNFDVTYGGLEKTMIGVNALSTIFSCHSCYRDDKIPVAFVDTTGKGIPFDMNATTPSLGTNLTYNQIQCLTPNNFELRIPNEQFLGIVPANCALLVVFTSMAKNFIDVVSPLTSLRCVECKPGFRAIKENGVVRSCVPIENCDPMTGMSLVSGCSRCLETYTWPVTQKLGTFTMSFERCVLKDDNNCLIVSNDFAKSCVICKNGFYLNYDNVCEAINSPLCKPGLFLNIIGDQFNALVSFANSNELMQLYYSTPIGCRECSTNYQPVLYQNPNRNMQACTQSPYVEERNFQISTTYIRNCRNYNVLTGNLLCTICDEGFILSIDSAVCVPKADYPWCLSVDVTSRRCLACNENFVLVRGYCEKQNIPFCLVYDTTEVEQICRRCRAGYRLVANTCIPGSVSNCDQYDYLGNCIKCLFNNVLVGVRNTQYCMPLNPMLNCTSVSTTATATQTTLTCTGCRDGFGLFPQTTPKSICLNGNLIEGCIQYDTKQLIGSSTFSCLKCNATYYLQNNWNCTLRQRVIPNCALLSDFNDFCSVCQPGYYLTNDKGCKQFPQGAWGCRMYISDTVCLICEPGKYLVNGQCYRIDDNGSIPGCLLYSSQNTCVKCMSNFFLTDNTCIPSIAQNCEEFDTISACSKCPPSFGFKIRSVEDVTDCVQIDNPYCLASSLNYPFDCLRCQNFYYVNNGRCFAVTTFIDNCMSYETSETCQSCAVGFVLSQDKKQCLKTSSLNIFDNICADLRYEPKPFCAVCGVGFYFSSNPGECVPCAKGLNVGCAFCSLQNTTKCEMCITGWYQTANGDCVQWNGLPIAQVPSTTVKPTFEKITWAVICLFLSLLAL